MSENDSVDRSPEELIEAALQGISDRLEVDEKNPKHLKDFADFISMTIREMKDTDEEKYKNDIKASERDLKFVIKKLESQNVFDYQPEESPEELSKKIDAGIRRQLDMVKSINEGEVRSYKGSIPNSFDGEQPYALFVMDTIQNIEKKIKELRENDKFGNAKQEYEEVYKQTVKTAVEMAEKNKSDMLIDFLGEYDRIADIDYIFQSDTEAYKRINKMAVMDRVTESGERKINPETLLHHFKTGYVDPENNGITNVLFVDGMKARKLIEMKMLHEAVKEEGDNPSIIDNEKKQVLGGLVGIIKDFEEGMSEEERREYEEIEKGVRNEGVSFINMSSNRKHLRNAMINDGHRFTDVEKGIMSANTEIEIKDKDIIADWEKKFDEHVEKLNAAEHKTLDKIKFRKLSRLFGGGDSTDSSYFTHSVVQKDEYGFIKENLYNVSRISKTMVFQAPGISNPNSYEIAALNARKNNWKTVSLNYGGSRRDENDEGVLFMQNSIRALIEHGNYTYDDIRVPKKYADVLRREKEMAMTISETPQNDEEYVTPEDPYENRQRAKNQAEANSGRKPNDDGGGGGSAPPSSGGTPPSGDSGGGEGGGAPISGGDESGGDTPSGHSDVDVDFVADELANEEMERMQESFFYDEIEYKNTPVPEPSQNDSLADSDPSVPKVGDAKAEGDEFSVENEKAKEVLEKQKKKEKEQKKKESSSKKPENGYDSSGRKIK